MTNETTKCDACETRVAAWESLDRAFACAECVGPKPAERGWTAMRVPATDRKPTRVLTCGCCTNGCTCFNHQDTPRGMPPRKCDEHKAMRVPAPILPSLVSAPETKLNGGAL